MTGRFKDGLRYLSRFTLRRAWNGIKVIGSYYFSRWTRKERQWGMPMAIAIEPTTACNLGCPECPSGLKQFSRPTGNLKSQLFRKTIDELAPTLTYLTFYFQGEPYIHPSFLDMVRYAHERKIYTATSTNAHFLNAEMARKTVRSGLDRLIISIDGTDQETYEQYRVKGSIHRVLEGTRHMVEAKKSLKSATPHLIFQFLVVKPNEHQVEEIKQLGKKMGVDEVRFKTAQVYHYENGNPLIPDNEKYSRYQKQKDGKYRIKNQMDHHCWKLWHSSVITWDGMVVPCCFDKDAAYRLGNLKRTDFKTLWYGDLYANFRQTVLQSRSGTDICRNCSEGTKVWA